MDFCFLYSFAFYSEGFYLKTRYQTEIVICETQKSKKEGVKNNHSNFILKLVYVSMTFNISISISNLKSNKKGYK